MFVGRGIISDRFYFVRIGRYSLVAYNVTGKFCSIYRELKLLSSERYPVFTTGAQESLGGRVSGGDVVIFSEHVVHYAMQPRYSS